MLTQVKHLGVRDESVEAIRHELLGRAVGQGPEENPAHRAEDRGVCTDAERQGEHGDDRKRRSSPQSTNGVPYVANEREHEAGPMRVVGRHHTDSAGWLQTICPMLLSNSYRNG